ncbi:lamin tail domain-containing protein [Ekhidna sp.]|uniref:lamin tail domain-containing protein n=1 Tax=Ekhidna sp. TaxID=2608089 RepID=UPI003CCBDC3F
MSWNLQYFRILLSVVFYSGGLFLNAQYQDDYEDETLGNTPNQFSPSLSGDVSNFILVDEGGDKQLRTNAGQLPSSDSYYLSIPSTQVSNTTWEFFIDLKFNPSGANYVDVFLVADQSDLTSVQNGYFVRIGDTEDWIALHKVVSGSTSSALISTAEDILNSSSSKPYKVQVTRDDSGNWELFTDQGVSGTFSSVGTVLDTDVVASSIFGFLVRQSTAASPANSHFFDDFFVGPTPTDSDPPEIQSVSVISDTQIDVQFNENVDESTAETVGNYSLDGGIAVSDAVRDATDNSVVHLTIDPLTNGTTYTLTINNVADENSNVIEPDSQDSFEYLILESAEENDVVINEFNAAPSASSVIPNEEFVELYNRSNKFISLENWQLSDKTGSSAAFGLDTLRPGEYLILTNTGNGSLFELYGDVLEISGFPSLNNGGDSIILTNASSTIIHETAYTSSSSGVSTELINPNDPDYSANNYGNSTDPDGGTPGEQNAIFDDTPDTTAPSISSISVISATELDVTFDEPLDETTAETTGNYTIDGGITINTAILGETDNQLVHLTVGTLPSGEIRTLTVNGVEDLSGNATNNAAIDFEYIETEPAAVNDVVINEFLASPSSSSSIPNEEYVELYNRSSRFIDLNGWTLSDAAGSSAAFGTFILRPDSFLILTETDNGSLFTSYGDVLEVNNFPSLNNGGDSIILTNASSTIIHKTAYTSSSSGVSTELINPNGPDYSANNYGNSTDPDGGTPGAQNAIFDDTPDTTAPSISSISVISDTELDVSFDESLDETTAETTGNYTIDGGITINTASLDETNNELVHLTVSTLPSGETRTLTVNGVEDLSGNATSNATIDFEYIETEPAAVNDVVINEFLASPSSSSSIPNEEYVELYNRSSKFIDLNGWTLSDAAGSSSAFGTFILRPDSFLILAETDNGSLFNAYGDVLEIDNFPSLNNGGDSIILTNASSTIIHETAYTSSSSGVSTELINPNGPDYSANNYGTSTDADGGTPGAQNSIFDDTPDTTPPSISSISVISDTELDVSFDESLDETTAETTGNYTIDGGNSVNTATLDDSDNKLVHLTVSMLPSGETQTLSVNGVEDLSGNATSNATIDFEYIETETAAVNDVVINEFLASPSSSSTIPNAEYVEVYNRSSKFIDLNGWTLSDAAGSSSAFGTFILRPDSFLILTETDNGSLFTSYGDVLEVNNFPSLNNGGDSIILTNASSTIIHETAYTSSSSGVSTELINSNGPDYSANNYGTSTDADGGTPGAQNAIFDDTPDTTAPSISSISVISDTELDVTFDEPLDETTAETTGNYTIDGGITINTASLDETNNELVHLTVSTLPSGETRTLTVNGVEDLSGNATSNAAIDFEYIETEMAAVNDVVINEFLAAPSTTSTIPNAEYVEVFNRSDKFIDLNGWTLSDAAGSSSAFGTFILRPDSFLILAETDNGSLFTTYGDVLEIDNFPSLNNGGDSIILTNASSTIIHETAYTSSSSGISTELINPNGPDYSANNYGTSTDPDGGTPGEQNAIFDDTPDTTPPSISSISVISDTELDVAFDEPLDETTAEATGNYSIEGGITIITASLDETNNQLVHLTVGTLPSGETRTLTVNGVEDLSGNATSNETIDFEYIETELAAVNDVVINEFLADPIPSIGLPEGEFVELYNRSTKNINLKNWRLDGSLIESFVLKPEDYVVLVDDSNLIKFEAYENVISIASLSLSNDEDQIILEDSTGNIINVISYQESISGISTELINPNDPCLSIASYSPSVNASGGTPGFQNAIFNETPDTQNPSIQSYSFEDDLTIIFSEVMDSLSLIAGTYEVSNDLNISSILVKDQFPESVSISFESSLEQGVIYELAVSGVSDCWGNTIESSIITFGIGRPPAFNDLIITEIMFDPDPQVELPSSEYLEIYNSTNDILSTEGLKLNDATGQVEIPSRMLNPGAYYILTSTSTASAYEGNAIGVANFPTLSNNGEQLIISRENRVIFTIDYDPDWHDQDKSSGGYSLEMKDINYPCLEDTNWGSSQDNSGGTPGMMNSISDDFTDNFSPEIVNVLAVDTDSVRVDFNEKISPISYDLATVEVSSGMAISALSFNGFYPNSLFIQLEEPLTESILYELTITGIQDCAGNSIDEALATFTLPVDAEEGDIKLSEILFNPRSNGVDFVEVYNSSEKYISLKGWQLGSFDEEGDIENKRVITSEALVIDPHAYLVFTTDSDILLTNYPQGVESNFIQVSSMPSFPNTEGSVVILNNFNNVADSFIYNEDYHDNLLESVDGVSLERVSFEQPNDANNWRSAASTVGFATPGYENSQQSSAETSSGRISATPEVFIPGNAGSGRDFTTINYQMETPGQFANVNIYDQSGRLVKNLAQGVLLSTQGFLRWDGDTNNGSMARMGYYLIIFEIYDSSGNSEVIKETVVVGRDF